MRRLGSYEMEDLKRITLENIDDLTNEERTMLEDRLQYMDQEVRKYIENRDPLRYMRAYRTILMYMTQTLTDDIKNAIEASNFGRDGRSTGVIHPSGIKGCTLRNIWKLTESGEKASVNVWLEMLADVGTAIHIVEQTYLLDMFDDAFYPELRIGDSVFAQENGIDGHADGILTLTFPTFVVDVNVEIKTVGKDKITKIVNGPLNDHKDQSIIYMKSLDTPYVLFLYVSRDDGKMRSQFYRFDDRRFNKLQKKIDTVNSLAGEEISPAKREALAQPSYFDCKDCEFSKACPKRKE